MSETTTKILMMALEILLSLTSLGTLFMGYVIKRKADETLRATSESLRVAKSADAKAAVIVQKTDEQTVKIDAVNVKTGVIEGHVNSEKTAAEGREATLAAENKLLREMLATQERTAALLAQSVATPTIQVLKQIDEHAAEIENNTANIETKVEALRNGT